MVLFVVNVGSGEVGEVGAVVDTGVHVAEVVVAAGCHLNPRIVVSEWIINGLILIKYSGDLNSELVRYSNGPK